MPLGLAIGSTFGAALASAVLPAINAELVLLAASAALPPRYAIALILAATLGQMVGKAGMFFGGRGVKCSHRRSRRFYIDG